MSRCLVRGVYVRNILITTHNTSTLTLLNGFAAFGSDVRLDIAVNRLELKPHSYSVAAITRFDPIMACLEETTCIK
jgi:hypothetical protein